MLLKLGGTGNDWLVMNHFAAILLLDQHNLQLIVRHGLGYRGSDGTWDFITCSLLSAIAIVAAVHSGRQPWVRAKIEWIWETSSAILLNLHQNGLTYDCLPFASLQHCLDFTALFRSARGLWQLPAMMDLHPVSTQVSLPWCGQRWCSSGRN